MPSGQEKNRQEKKSSELIIKQKDIIHYVKRMDDNGVMKYVEITKEEYEAIKDDANQTAKELNYTQWRKLSDYEALCADPKKYQERLKKAQDKMEENCYYKKIEQDGLIKYIDIEEEEYTQNKDNPNFFQALYRVFNEDRNYRGQIYIDSNAKRVPKKIYHKMTQEERDKKFTIVQAGPWRRKKSDDKKRKRDNYNNNNNQADPTPIPVDQNQPQNLDTNAPAISEDAELLLGLSIEQSAKKQSANPLPEAEATDLILHLSTTPQTSKPALTNSPEVEKSDDNIIYAKQIINEYDLIKVEKISKDEYLENKNDKNYFTIPSKKLTEYRRVHQQIFVDKDNNNEIEEDKYKLMSPQEREDKLRKTTKSKLKNKKYGVKRKPKKKSTKPVSRQSENSNQTPLQNTPTVSRDNHGEESEKKVYLKRISENGKIKYEKITKDEYLEYPNKDQIFELEERKWDCLSKLFTDDPFTHNFAFFNNPSTKSQSSQTSSSFTHNRPPARTPTIRK